MIAELTWAVIATSEFNEKNNDKEFKFEFKLWGRTLRFFVSYSRLKVGLEFNVRTSRGGLVS